MRTIDVPVRITPIATLAMVIAASFAFGGAAETGEVSGGGSAVAEGSASGTPEVVLYYFHGTRRCNTCRTIESYAQEAVEGKFEDALRDGRLGWTALNTDEAENAHFVEDFGLVSSSLVLVEVDGGEIVRHEILQDAWTLVRNKPRFIAYVRKAVAEYLE